MAATAGVDTNSSADLAMWPVPHTAVTRSLTDPSKLRIAWGEGSARDAITDLSPALAAWLLSLRGPITPRRMTDDAKARLGLSATAAHTLVGDLVRRGFVVTEEPAMSDAHRIWSTIGWHDAVALHGATRNTTPRIEPLGAPEDDLPALVDRTCLQAIALPAVSAHLDQADFLTAFRNRRTHRNFQDTSITVQQLADLLHWTFRAVLGEGSQSAHTTPFSMRRPDGDVPAEPLTAFVLLDPKTGPSELLKVDWRFRYSARHHTLEPAGDGPKIESISELLWEQDFSVGAPAFVIFCVNWREYMARHRSSYGYRLSQMDLGAFMQTALVVASALDLRTFLTPALDDERFAQILGTEDSEQAPCYMLAIGGRQS